MKRTIYNIVRTALVSFALMTVVSCNDFLDALPDNRTEVDTAEKIKELLVSAYTEVMLWGPMEMMSDNVVDYGHEVSEGYVAMSSAYKFQECYETYYDSPHYCWENTYKAIASANYALQACEKYGEIVNAEKGEALICRAYSHFLLACYFCQAYNPQSSDTDLGIPYVTEPEETVYVDYDRGTVAEVYEKIAADIEAGFPLINDAIYQQPTYHLNRRAAAAFAAQFYLYYGKYEKAVEYADIVLGDDPTALFRDWEQVEGTNTDEISNIFVRSGEPANIFIHASNSLCMRYRSNRYCHPEAMLEEVEASDGPWGDKLNWYQNTWFFAGRHYAMPKIREWYLVLDPVAFIVEPYVLYVMFSTEKTLLDRAEAHAMLGNWDLAARDLCWFYESSKTPTNKTAKQLSDYYDKLIDKKIKKPLAPRFTLEPGMQTNLIHACLHARRIVTVEEGWRTMDLKRFGIAYSHNIDGGSPINIEPYDKRLAIQIPSMAVMAGIEPNPR